ncbi:hypothetical protein GCM10009535_12330 [Streptomyces thermocarboxydovorans]|uniref:Uncharacterized protein n=1 Tax=Streptomyces thermocarboxydovorans TaxID=59298 RepID=A0ABN1HBZ7_9ACTN
MPQPVDCDPTWTDTPPGQRERTPTGTHLRHVEIHDMTGQARLVDLWNAETVPVNDQYL